MNFYQKCYGLISLLVIAITSLITFAFFDPPYSQIFVTETAAIIFAEFLMGGVTITYIGKNDSSMVHTAGYIVVAFLYLLFTLLMIMLTFSDISPKKFLTIHIAGFVIALIIMIHYYMTEHNIDEQSQTENITQAAKNDLRNRIEEISVRGITVFTDIPGLRNEMDRLVEKIRFSRDPDDRQSLELQRISHLIDDLMSAIHTQNRDLFQAKLVDLKNAIYLYEKKV